MIRSARISIINGRVLIGTTRDYDPDRPPTALVQIRPDASLAPVGTMDLFRVDDVLDTTGFLVGTDSTPFLIKQNGNVGIGTTDPRTKLDVAGVIHASGLAQPSDARLKQRVSPLTDVLPKLERLHGVSFEWNQHAESLGHRPGEPDIGVIAQEVAAVFPELVTSEAPGRYQAVDYSRLTAVLLEAIKELRRRQVFLEARIADLEARQVPDPQ